VSARHGYSTNSSAAKEVPNEEHLVYVGSMTRMLKGLKVLSLTTSVIGLGAQPMLFEAASKSSVATLLMGISSVFALFAVLTPLALSLLTKRYITELYFDPEKRVFTAFSLNLVNRRRCTSFSAADVIIPAVDGPFTSFKVFQKPFLVDPDQFSDPKVYHHLMGFDQPLEEFIAEEQRKNKLS
jgi:transmembrane protein 70